MPVNYSKIIGHYGIRCFDGGQFFVCEGADTEFVGCCDINPCTDGKGVCPGDKLKTMNLLPENYQEPLLSLDCDHPNGTDIWDRCDFGTVRIAGCFTCSPCDTHTECSTDDFFPAKLPPIGNREAFLNPEDVHNLLASSLPSSASLAPQEATQAISFPDPSKIDRERETKVSPGEIVGIWASVVVFTLLLLGVFWRNRSLLSRRKHRILRPKAHAPFIRREPSESTSGSRAHVVASASPGLATRWHGGPKSLHRPEMTWYLGWIWDLVLTLIPTCFIVLAVLAIRLDNQAHSDLGERIIELTRLSPTLYPILFVAIVGRFYKNVARWCLEQPEGTRLALLEQLFGSQSFTAALGRVFSVRTKAALGLIILLSWAMSPIGGQSASRLLYNGTATFTSDGTIYYADPVHQVSYYAKDASEAVILAAGSSVDVLYSTCLLSSRQQKRAPRDLWGLPKIPQWPRHRTDWTEYDVNKEDFESGKEYYSSLLGIKIQGLVDTNARTHFDFSVQTSYLDIDCKYVDTFNPLVDKLSSNQTFFKDIFGETFWTFAIVDDGFFMHREDSDPDDGFEAPYLFSYVKQHRDASLSVVNCSMIEVSVQTTIRCGPGNPATTCEAKRQRRLDSQSGGSQFPISYDDMESLLRHWVEASNDNSGYTASPTEIYMMKDSNSYSGEAIKPWTEGDLSVFPSLFSRRITTAFNTFWASTLNPHGHTNVEFDNTPRIFSPEQNLLSLQINRPTGQLFMNTRIGTRTVSRDVYRANRVWIGILLFTTALVQILAITGLVLQAMIRGPDILGYASSMTRDNPYVPLPPGGSHLDGPERARRLGDVRLHLMDVRPEDETGYVAVAAVPLASMQEDSDGGDEESGKEISSMPLSRKRLYD